MYSTKCLNCKTVEFSPVANKTLAELLWNPNCCCTQPQQYEGRCLRCVSHAVGTIRRHSSRNVSVAAERRVRRSRPKRRARRHIFPSSLQSLQSNSWCRKHLLQIQKAFGESSRRSALESAVTRRACQPSLETRAHFCRRRRRRVAAPRYTRTHK